MTLVFANKYMNPNNNVNNMNLNNLQKIHMYTVWVALYLFILCYFLPLTTIGRGEEDLNPYFLIRRIRQHHWVTNLLPSISFVMVKYLLKLLFFILFPKNDKKEKKNSFVTTNINLLFHFLYFTLYCTNYNFSYIHLINKIIKV